MIGRYCEEFTCTPSVAMREWLSLPAGFLDEVIEARQFAAAKGIYDRAEKKSDLPASPMIDLVKRIEFAQVREEMG